MIIREDLSIEQKLVILGDAAKYDVACTSSGVNRKGEDFSMGNAVKAGLCHSFTADGRCVSLLKVLMTNECIYECRYCINRASNDIVRTTFTPQEIAELTIQFYRRNYIEGLFLSSGIYPSPQASAERMLEAVKLLRKTYRFGGYIHVKTIPGADSSTIEETGWFADRMSVNLELPTAESLKNLAPNKTRKNILTPMRMIQDGIQEEQKKIYISDKVPSARQQIITRNDLLYQPQSKQIKRQDAMSHFVPAGQSTQMIIGASPENDYQIMSVTEKLYQNFNLKRVFYSAFVNVNQDENMVQWGERELLEREHRLYQADFLLRFYRFKVEDLLSLERPNFNRLLDPKCDYALRHLEWYPIEVNRASYDQLLKIPGIGVKSAQRIIKARRMSQLDFKDLKKIGVVMKRAVYFMTCKGRMMYPIQMSEDVIMHHLLDENDRRMLKEDDIRYQQISLFDLMSDHT